MKTPLNFSKVYITIAALLVISASFGAGTWYGYVHQPAVAQVLNVDGQKPPSELSNVDFSLFWNVWQELESKYVDHGQINRQNLVYGAISGLVNSLNDPYTVFFPPKESKAFQDDINGSFEGIGAEIGIKNSILTIIAPLKGSPAEKSGLKAGDEVLKIDGKSTSNINLDEAVNLIRGKKGTVVVLNIYRSSFSQPKDVSVTRDTIEVPIVETTQKPNGIFVITLHQFTANAGDDFKKAVEQFYQSHSNKLILDLRADPGGYLDQAVNIASYFIASGKVVVIEKDSDGTETDYRSAGYQLLQNTPVVVLVDGGSASAAEILAGALRDDRAIKLVGEQTFGKGSVQQLENLSGGSSLKITIAKWLTPNGKEINHVGLTPDVIQKMPEASSTTTPANADPQMNKAIQMLEQL